MNEFALMEAEDSFTHNMPDSASKYQMLDEISQDNIKLGGLRKDIKVPTSVDKIKEPSNKRRAHEQRGRFNSDTHMLLGEETVVLDDHEGTLLEMETSQ